ncbi:hypothetical protein SPRG_15080 [Saprolegnia parasitica CBS 223.65]|uniref:Cell wall-active antibiotics response LiaF-like C-terminal domain-containing protein n=1 Tax=Saprolegnia parasitica (strain CBS 223.65) TaxID=695850 RepID=A0A067BSG2_SAPPC|nr:hypothetical protein SPRG_15080 [Saprolegnia parasitica CBS 223.65]KDO19750.1 hypothetical protein SPRG_15080 [Saprolegnia parasitica CBS 223.65]|eukprot:XP_012209560.1 hypothetical protein SPRG_15080 [Saprolegnia parasitica CBS 223.65]
MQTTAYLSTHQPQYLVGNTAHLQAERDAHKMGYGGGTLFISAGSFIHAAGPIVVPRRIVITVVLKGATVDLTQATFVHPVTEVQICAVLGGVKLILPRGVRCETSGLSIFGSFKNANNQSASLGANAPLVRITGLSVFGGAKASVCMETAPLVVVPSLPEVTIETAESLPLATPAPEPLAK